MIETNDVLRVLQSVQRIGSGWVARCPVPGHGKGKGDKTPSLTITDSHGKALFHCKAGCTQGDVIDALKSRLPGFGEGLKTVSLGLSKPAVLACEPAKTFSWEEHAVPYQNLLETNPRVQQWLLEQRGIAMDPARLLRLGYKPDHSFRGKGCPGDCPECRPKPALVIPISWRDKLLGIKYRALEPVADHKWSTEPGSSTKVIHYADLEPTDFCSDSVLVAEGPLDAAMLLSQGYSAVAISSASALPKSPDAWPFFREGIEELKKKYAHVVCLGDQTEDGRAAMNRLKALIGPGADRFPLFVGNAKDVTEAFLKQGIEEFRRDIDAILQRTQQSRPVPQHESVNAATDRIARSLQLHSQLHISRLAPVIQEHVGELQRLVTAPDSGYPEFPYRVMEGTSLHDGFARPVSEQSAKNVEFLWLPAVVQFVAHLFGRVQIEDHNRTPYGVQLHILGSPRTSHKSSSVELSMNFMFHAGAIKNDGGGIEPLVEDARVLVQTGGSLEGCGLRMQQLQTCRGLLFYDELRKLADKAGIEGSSMVPDLLTVADAGQWANRVKRKNESFAFRPHEYVLSLITCCPSETFQDCWSRFSGSSMSGLNERGFFLLEPSTPKEQKRAQDPDYGPARKTKALIETAVLQGSFSTTPEAESILDAAVKRLGVQWTSRLEVLSLYFAVDLGRREIDSDCAQRAEALCSYGKHTLEHIRPIDADSKLAALQQRIVQALQRAPDRRMQLRTLKKNLHFHRYDTQMQDKALQGLAKTLPPVIATDPEPPRWVSLLEDPQ